MPPFLTECRCKTALLESRQQYAKAADSIHFYNVVMGTLSGQSVKQFGCSKPEYVVLKDGVGKYCCAQ